MIHVSKNTFILITLFASLALSKEEPPEGGEKPEEAKNETEASGPDIAALEALNKSFIEFSTACENLLALPPFNADQGEAKTQWNGAAEGLLSSLKEANKGDEKLTQLLEKFETEYQDFKGHDEKFANINSENVDEALMDNSKEISEASAASSSEDSIVSAALSDSTLNDKDKMEYEIVDFMFSCLESQIILERTKLEEFGHEGKGG